MRTKEPCFVLSFHTTADAIAFERQAQTVSFPGRLIPLPRAISAGCGMAWRIRKCEFPHFSEAAIADLEIPYEQIYDLLL